MRSLLSKYEIRIIDTFISIITLLGFVIHLVQATSGRVSLFNTKIQIEKSLDVILSAKLN